MGTALMLGNRPRGGFSILTDRDNADYYGRTLLA
jgi:hypothetical protein